MKVVGNQISVSANKVLLEHCHPYFICKNRWLLFYHGRDEWLQQIIWLAKPEIVTIGPFTTNYADPWIRGRPVRRLLRAFRAKATAAFSTAVAVEVLSADGRSYLGKSVELADGF